MIKFIVCDDDKKMVEKVSNIIHKVMMPYDYDYRIDKYEKYTDELQKEIKTKGANKIYILDIEMPKVSGLEIASEIREEDWESIIVFLTSHPECKNDIFYSRLLAFDFISKYQLALARIEDTIKFIMKEFSNKQMLCYTFNHIVYRIPHHKILYIARIPKTRKCNVYLKGNYKYETNLTITELDKILGPDFYRCHNSAVVNVSNIMNFDKINGVVTFRDNSQMTMVSDRSRKGLEAYVSKY